MGEPKIELGAVWVHKASGRRFVVNGVEGTTNTRTGEFAHEPGERISLLREDGLLVDVDAKHRAIFAPMPERGQLWKSKSTDSVVEVVVVHEKTIGYATKPDRSSGPRGSATLADFVAWFEPVGDEQPAEAAYQGYAKGSPRIMFDVGAYVKLMSGWDELDAKLRDPTGPDALPPFTLRTPKPAEPSPCITCGAPATETYCDPCERYHAADFTEPTLATICDSEEECSLRITPNCTRWLGVGVLAAWWDDEKASCLACAEKKIRDSDAAYDDMYAGIEARRKAHGWVET